MLHVVELSLYWSIQEACKEVLDGITELPGHTESLCGCHQVAALEEPEAQFMFITNSNDVFSCGAAILMSALKVSCKLHIMRYD